MKKRILFQLFFILLSLHLSAQNTVGILSYDANKTYEGYNLLYPNNQEKVFLLNNCGEIVHIWNDEEDFRPGNTAYLRENGDLIKCKRHNFSNNDPIWAGGGGAFVEIRNWENELLWSFEQNDSFRRLHHDIEPMPNGNILMISWEYKSVEEAVQAGRDAAMLPDAELWPDYILEINPTNNEVVWEWHTWDHLIQELDATKDNYGVVANHPELIDLNWTANDGRRDWMHTNAIDYNEELDQVVISVPTFNEIWIIDHSTTTAEAAGHNGGLSGGGGDLMYRWGNPLTYQAGTFENQQLFFQHDIHWVGDFLDTSHPHFGKLAVFNNTANLSYSTANVFAPDFDTSTWSYQQENGVWSPVDFDVTFTHPEPTNMFSPVVSSVQLLANGNTLICAGKKGYAFELSPENEVVWEYKTPLNGGNPVSQGTLLNSGNLTFRHNRYPINFAAFEGRGLTPFGYIELNPDTDFCDLTSPVVELAATIELEIFPNPASDEIQFKQAERIPSTIAIFDYTGRKMLDFELNTFFKKINVSNWPDGLYFVQVNEQKFFKFVVNK